MRRGPRAPDGAAEHALTLRMEMPLYEQAADRAAAEYPRVTLSEWIRESMRQRLESGEVDELKLHLHASRRREQAAAATLARILRDPAYALVWRAEMLARLQDRNAEPTGNSK